jgi:uncharacterized surface protein with fasciclin (FAS1) repeats
MKKFIFILGLLIVIVANFSCVRKKEFEANFKEQVKFSIYDYMVAHKENYSSFLSIISKGGIDKILSAYNPNAEGYTLFLPDNKAIDKYIQENGKYTSLGDLLNDAAYVAELCRYHVVDMGINADDFPFGALPAYTLTGDYLTVSFISNKDTAYYKINNQAPVIHSNIKLSNGYIHVIGDVLRPITYTTYNWLEQNTGYSIFKAAVEITGLKSTLDINIKNRNNTARPFTLLVEHDSVFHKRKIYSLEDLEKYVSPLSADYTKPSNPLYSFVAYHLLAETQFLNNFANKVTNYTSYSDVPVLIDGSGMDIEINKGKENFDTIIHYPDTTIINYVGFNYDASNVLSQSGVIHFINQVMTQKTPTRAIQTFEFYEEPIFSKLRLTAGSYLIEDSTSLSVVKWTGPNLIFVEADATSTAYSHDYLYLNGDFTISYTIPKLVQGNYKVILRADAFSPQNAIVQVYIDGKNVGGLVNLTTDGSASDPFFNKQLGSFNFLKYEHHVVEIKSLIPGRFLWDFIRFEPL